MANGISANGAGTISQAEGDLAEVGADYDDLRQQVGQMVAMILAAPPPAEPSASGE